MIRWQPSTRTGCDAILTVVDLLLDATREPTLAPTLLRHYCPLCCERSLPTASYAA